MKKFSADSVVSMCLPQTVFNSKFLVSVFVLSSLGFLSRVGVVWDWVLQSRYICDKVWFYRQDSHVTGEIVAVSCTTSCRDVLLLFTLGHRLTVLLCALLLGWRVRFIAILKSIFIEGFLRFPFSSTLCDKKCDLQ